MSCHNSRITPANGSPGRKRKSWRVNCKYGVEDFPASDSRTRKTTGWGDTPVSRFTHPHYVTAEWTSSVKQLFFSFKNEEVNIKTTSASISFVTSPPFFLLAFSIFPNILLLLYCDFRAYRKQKTCLLKCLQISLGTFSKLRLDTGKCRLLYFVPQKLQLFMIKVFWSPQASLWFSSVILNKAGTSTNQVQTYQATSIVVFLLW